MQIWVTVDKNVQDAERFKIEQALRKDFWVLENPDERVWITEDSGVTFQASFVKEHAPWEHMTFTW